MDQPILIFNSLQLRRCYFFYLLRGCSFNKPSALIAANKELFVFTSFCSCHWRSVRINQRAMANCSRLSAKFHFPAVGYISAWFNIFSTISSVLSNRLALSRSISPRLSFFHEGQSRTSNSLGKTFMKLGTILNVFSISSSVSSYTPIYFTPFN